MGASGRMFSTSKAARVGAALVWTALVASACDSDEIKNPGGTAGSAGTAGSGGNSSGAGKTGSGAETSDAGESTQQGGSDGAGGSDAAGGQDGGEDSSNRLGRPCLSDPDCQAPGQAALTCIKPTDLVLDGGAPPHGLCTLSCLDHDECNELSPGSICYPFDDAAPNGYCIEGCAFGPPALGTQKCHNRADFVCGPALLGDTGEPCTAGSCPAGELCLGGTCGIVFPGCLPSCRGDIDCAAGTFCDQSYNTGVCVPEEPTGKGLGEPCTVQDEPDECLGFCQADSALGDEGHCATTCPLGTGCAYDSATDRFEGACFYTSALTGPDSTQGDFGFCTPACNCSEDCDDPSLGCALPNLVLPATDFRGPGLCFSGVEPADELDLCGGGGAPGTAGAPSTAGAPGTGGVGGAP